MNTGKLAISRGHQMPDVPHLALVPRADEPAPTPRIVAPASPEYQVVHDRLTSLERLTRLVELGALSAEEFAVEKSLILALPADELVPRQAAPAGFAPAESRPARRGPSLVGRMLSWRFLLFSLVMGLGGSFVAQPDQTIRFFDQTLRYFGA